VASFTSAVMECIMPLYHLPSAVKSLNTGMQVVCLVSNFYGSCKSESCFYLLVYLFKLEFVCKNVGGRKIECFQIVADFSSILSGI
jgi:hypothetical protein